MAVASPEVVISDIDGCCDRPTAQAAPRRLALSQLRRGQAGVVRSADLAAPDASMLGAMGLHCNATVRLCRAGEPCIVAVVSGGRQSCRIGLARPLAERIMVDVTESVQK